MASRSTRYQGQDYYDRASANVELADQVEDELMHMYEPSIDDELVNGTSIASLMGRTYEDGPAETPMAEISQSDVARLEAAPELAATESAAGAKPGEKRELGFLEKMVMNMRSMFA